MWELMGRAPVADRTSSDITINAGKPEIMAVIADFPSYPEWAEGIKSAEVVSVAEDGRAAEVRFRLEAGPIKDHYSLLYDWHGDDQVDWRLGESGSVLSGMTGTYRLTERGEGTTHVSYDLAVDMKVPMLGMLKRRGEKIIIDAALKGLKRRLEH